MTGGTISRGRPSGVCLDRKPLSNIHLLSVQNHIHNVHGIIMLAVTLALGDRERSGQVCSSSQGGMVGLGTSHSF